MIQQIQKYFASKSFSTHSFVAAVLFLMGLYIENPMAKDLVDQFLSHYPTAAKLLAVAVVIYAKYSHSTPQAPVPNQSSGIRAGGLSIFALVCLLSLGAVVGTQTACSAKHPIHAGAVNQVDSDVYDSLLTCQGALEQAKAEFGTNPAAKVTLNQAIVSYNAALDGYLAYKAGRSLDLVVVQAQISNIIQDIGSLKQQFGGGVKKQ